MLDGNGFGFGDAVEINELRQNERDFVLFEIGFGGVQGHGMFHLMQSMVHAMKPKSRLFAKKLYFMQLFDHAGASHDRPC